LKEDYPEEKTIVLYEPEEMVNSALEFYSRIKYNVDVCGDYLAPKLYMEFRPLWDAYLEVKNRGVKIRFITEITTENLSYCKEFIKTCELRHLDGINFGGFGIADKNEYRSSTASNEGDTPPNYVICTVRTIVEQQQLFFDMLWKKAIPAWQRIKEIEEDLKREFIETIQDSEETLNLISKVISSATEEVLIIFSRAYTLRQYQKHGILDLLKRKAEQEISVRILIGMDHSVAETTIESLKGYQHIELRYLLKSIQTKLTTIVADRGLSLVIEEKENEDTIGLATYSNSESTVLSYASIFENLWIQSTSNNLP
jgi:sugar-specific transcriptional regulator TrmB